MQYHAGRALIERSLWERKLIDRFPFLERIIRFFLLVGLYSLISAVVVWCGIVIIVVLVLLAGPAPQEPPYYI